MCCIPGAQVNKRVAKQEQADHSGDPFYPKVQWPSPEACPLCRIPSLSTRGPDAEPEWNEDEVYRFLLAFYGNKATSDAAASLFGNRCVCKGGPCCAGSAAADAICADPSWSRSATALLHALTLVTLFCRSLL